MKRFALAATGPLRPPQQLLLLPPRVRHACHHGQTVRAARTSGTRSFSHSPSRVSSDSPPRVFTRYTLPPNLAPNLAPRPGAPLDLPPASMSAAAPRELPPRRTAYIALGSNLGDRIGWIEKACNEMDARGIRVRRTSSLWETEPMYVLDQDRFVNGACEVETTLEPLELLDALQDIERSLGRKKVVDKGPRNIDLDILLYEDLKLDHDRLKIPHVGIPEREFVLRPLAE